MELTELQTSLYPPYKYTLQAGCIYKGDKRNLEEGLQGINKWLNRDR